MTGLTIGRQRLALNVSVILVLSIVLAVVLSMVLAARPGVVPSGLHAQGNPTATRSAAAFVVATANTTPRTDITEVWRTPGTPATPLITPLPTQTP